MAKKDFSSISTAPVYRTIAEATRTEELKAAPLEDTTAAGTRRKERKTYTPEETAAFIQNGQTVGRKGVKLPRINMAFSPDNYEFIQTMARVRGQSLTEFVNHIIRLSMDQNQEIYKRAIEFRNSL